MTDTAFVPAAPETDSHPSLRRQAWQLTALIMAHGLASVAQAESAPPKPAASATNAPVAMEKTVITGQTEKDISSVKYTEPLRDTAQTINVVPRSVIEEQGATTLRDVLRNVPGISFQAGEGGVPAGDQLSIRGFSARTDLFIDGVRDLGGYTRDSFNIEQVEVTKGPNSAYSGRGSTGGSVNMSSKTPKPTAFYEGTFGYGTDDYYRTTLDFNQPVPQLDSVGLKGAAFRVNGLFHDQDFADRDFIHDRRWAVAPSFAIGLGTDTRVILSYLHLQEDNLAGYGLPFVSSGKNPYGGAAAVGHIAPVPYQTFFGLVDRDFEKIANDLGGVRIEHDFNEDVTLRHQTRYGRTRRDSAITAPRVITNPSANADYDLVTVGADTFGLNHELQSRDQLDQVFSTQTDLTSKFDTGKLSHTLVTSVEYSHETSVNYLRSAGVTPWKNGSNYYPAPLDNPLDPDPHSQFGPISRTGARNQAISDAAGLSAFDTIKLGEKWLIPIGIRGDTFSTAYNQRATNGVVTSLNHTDIEPTWRGGLVFKPRPNGSIYFGYGTSFNPSAEGLTLATNTVNLDPELGTSYELGTKWDLFKERLSVSAAMFRTDKQNYRNTDPVTSIVSNSGEVRVEGIEFGISGRITPEWSMYGGYALMQSEILSSKTSVPYNNVSIPEQGHPLSNTPQQTASLWTTYALPFRFTVGTGVSYVDKRFSNNIETSSVPGYWLQDALFSWKATDNLDFRLNVSNLWGKEYIDRVGGGHAIPGTGRTFILTASLKF
jgi:catecholate siderophore receptor